MERGIVSRGRNAVKKTTAKKRRVAVLESRTDEPALLFPFRASGAETGLDAHRRY